MTISITSRGTTAREAFKASLERKLSKLDRFFDSDAAASVTVSTESGRETVEVTIKAGGMYYRAEKTTGDRLDSLDLVVDALFRQIVKNKTRLEKRLRKGSFDPGYEHDFVAPEDSISVARSKKYGTKPIDVEEAILQMNMVGHSFYAFINSETEEFCVVYRREGGGYGLLEPGADDE